MNHTNITTKTPKNTNQLLKAILAELHLLRNDINAIMGEDSIDNYTNPKRIKDSYESALKEYPPQTL